MVLQIYTLEEKDKRAGLLICIEFEGQLSLRSLAKYLLNKGHPDHITLLQMTAFEIDREMGKYGLNHSRTITNKISNHPENLPSPK